MASQPAAKSIAEKFDIFNVSKDTKGKGVKGKGERPTTYDFSVFFKVNKKINGDIFSMGVFSWG